MTKKTVFIPGLLLLLLSQTGGWTAPVSFGGVTLTRVYPRIVTPNGDLRNDAVLFEFDNPLSGLPVEAAVLDINGAKVSGMALNSNETILRWDGKDESGQDLPSGIYIYSIKIGKNIATGTVVVAR